MKEIVIKTDHNKLLVKLKKEFYERDAVFFAAYKFTDICSILIEPIDNYTVGVYFSAFKGREIDLKGVAKAYCNEVLDQQIRLDLEKRYGNIRDLIVKQAFAPIKNLREEINIDE